MISAIWDDEGFKRSYRKRIKKNDDRRRRFWQRMELFLAVPFSPQLRTHKLSGKLESQWAFSVDDDCLPALQRLSGGGCSKLFAAQYPEPSTQPLSP